MRKIKKLLSTLLVLAVVVTGYPSACTAADTTTQTDVDTTVDYGRKPDDSYIHRSTGGKKSQTMSSNDYSKEAWGQGWHAQPSNDFLEENEDGTFLRISFFDDEGVFLETYDADFNFVSSRQLTKGIWTARGYFKGKDARYIVYKQVNSEQSDEKEVVRVVKYDDDWNILGRCSISAINTYSAFTSGSVSMLESDGILYIHAAHTMYDEGTLLESPHHQANMTLEIDEVTMTKVADMSAVSNEKTGYVSHSWNQFIQADDNYIYRLDQGDSSPRAVTLSKQKKYYEGIDMYHIEDRREIFPICGTGQVYTGVSIGSFDLIGNTLIIVGNSIDPDTTDRMLNMVKWRNVFVDVTDKDTFDTKTIWLTNYTDDDKIIVYTPHTVVTGDGMYVLWEEGYQDQEDGDYNILTRIAKIKNDGTLDGKIYRICARQTDCKPILTSKGHIVWFMTNDSSPVFYDVDPARLDDICFEGPGYIQLSTTTMKLSQDTYTEIEDSSHTHSYRPDVEVYYKGEKLTQDRDYTVSYEDNYTQGTAYAVVMGKGVFTGWNKAAFTILPAEEDNTWDVPDWWGTAKPSQTPAADPNGNRKDTPSATATAKPSQTPKPTKAPANSSKATSAASPSRKKDAAAKLKLTKPKTGKLSGNKLYVCWTELTAAKGYQLQYAQSKNFKKKLKTVNKNVSTQSYTTLKKLQKKKAYYIRVRAYTQISGKKIYGKWSPVKKVKY